MAERMSDSLKVRVEDLVGKVVRFENPGQTGNP
jgi:hypothetical protein